MSASSAICTAATPLAVSHVLTTAPAIAVRSSYSGNWLFFWHAMLTGSWPSRAIGADS